MWPSYYLKASKRKIKVISYAYFRICNFLNGRIRQIFTNFNPESLPLNDLEVWLFGNQFMRAFLFKNLE